MEFRSISLQKIHFFLSLKRLFTATVESICPKSKNCNKKPDTNLFPVYLARQRSRHYYNLKFRAARSYSRLAIVAKLLTLSHLSANQLCFFGQMGTRNSSSPYICMRAQIENGYHPVSVFYWRGTRDSNPKPAHS